MIFIYLFSILFVVKWIRGLVSSKNSMGIDFSLYKYKRNKMKEEPFPNKIKDGGWDWKESNFIIFLIGIVLYISRWGFNYLY